MKQADFSRILERSARNGSSRALGESSHNSQSIKLSEAYLRYGRDQVKRWISEGLVRFRDTTGGDRRKSLDREQLERIAASNNRSTYIPVRER